jgi:hypothetical protein
MMQLPYTKRVAALIVAGACTLGGASCSSSKSASKDVKIVSCKADPGGGKPTASGTIVNHSSKTSRYSVHVKFYDSSGNAVGDGISAVASVDPDETAKWDTTGSVNAKGPVTCKLETVTRNQSV